MSEGSLFCSLSSKTSNFLVSSINYRTSLLLSSNMLKLAATSATLLASASASASESSLKGHSYNTGLQAAFAEGTRSTQAQLNAAGGGVEGAWFMETVGESRSCNSTENYYSGGYKMGLCMQNDNGQNVKYSCIEDSSTGDVVLSMSTYTDDACTAGPIVQPSVTYSTTCSGAGKTASCQDTNSYSTDMAEYSNGTKCILIIPDDS
jgi:hypothetical protein